MEKLKKLLILISILLFFSLQHSLHAYVFTKEAPMIKRDKFLLGAGILEYYKKKGERAGSVFKIPFIIHLGLAKRVEFIGIFPYIQLKNIRNEPETFGDILIFLKFDMKNFSFHYPPLITKTAVKNQLDLVIGFNTATGPYKEMKDGLFFSPYSLGLPDFRLGILYTQTIDNFSLDIDFIYTFASHLGEDYLPFTGSLWNNKKKSYVFGIVNVLVKFLWPGKYPWADKEAPEWELYPHHDDFFHWNTGFKYHFQPKWLLFSYDIFTEINWVKTWSKHSIYPTFILITPGLNSYLTDSLSITGGVSFIIFKHIYHEDEEFYFDNLYFLGIKFLL